MGKRLYKNRGSKICFPCLLLVISMIIGSATVFSGCSEKNSAGKSGSGQIKQEQEEKQDLVTLDVYHELSSFSGIQEGWMADVLENKFHVKINIIPLNEDYIKEYKETGDIGDIVIWSNSHSEYTDAVNNNLLYDWDKNGLLEKYGAYIKENMPTSLRKNRKITSEITKGQRETLYGFIGGMAASEKDHDGFFNTWDIRWDIYKKLGYPKVKDLKDFEKLVKDMVKACPTNDAGDKTYGISLWSDWDDAKSMVMNVSSTASAYYGYDELGIGFYDPVKGKFHDALEKGGSYLEMLKFYNNLYQDGLLDPDSAKQSYDDVIKKVKNGSTMFSILKYTGSLVYNTSKHMQAGKLMRSMKPEQASPLVYGEKLEGNNVVWSIGAKTKYPEKCMEIINWLCTPEGYLTTLYGPKDVCWKYNSNKKTELTELGKKCREDGTTELGEGYEGRFLDGISQLGHTWGYNASNPETAGETYNSETWESDTSKPKTEMEKDWCEKTGAWGVYDYLEKGGYTISPGSDFNEEEKSPELEEVWKKVSEELISASWRAIYAKTDSQYNRIVNEMIKRCEKYGYDKCVKWSANEAARRKSIEDAITK